MLKRLDCEKIITKRGDGGKILSGYGEGLPTRTSNVTYELKDKKFALEYLAAGRDVIEG